MTQRATVVEHGEDESMFTRRSARSTSGKSCAGMLGGFAMLSFVARQGDGSGSEREGYMALVRLAMLASGRAQLVTEAAASCLFLPFFLRETLV
jgi:hypothetical protein